MNLVRRIGAGALVTGLAAVLGACALIGASDVRGVGADGGLMSALDGGVRLSVPENTVTGEARIRFAADPIPANRAAPDGILLLGDMVSMNVESGVLGRARISLRYENLPYGIDPTMLNVFGWAPELNGWVPLTGTVIDYVENTVNADTVLFDSFAVGTWDLERDITGDRIRTSTGTVLPVSYGATRTFWGYATSAAKASVKRTTESLLADGAFPVVAPLSAGSRTSGSAAVVSGGSGSGAVVSGSSGSGTGAIPAGADIPDAENGTVAALRNATLAYLSDSVAVTGAKAENVPGGKPDWSVLALDGGLELITLLLPHGQVLTPASADALMKVRADYAAAALPALIRGDGDAPEVRRLVEAAGLTGSGQYIADVFRFAGCVRVQTARINGVHAGTSAGWSGTAKEVVSITGLCADTIIDQYLVDGATGTRSVLNTLKTMPTAVKATLPKSRR
ncbi:hypothetical protein [Actinoplanes rectilineatus]|uniref:hypothetical protein n=1 Tax=Actinoplanes rectilineatus TaxID=113571 RepID=UPI000B2DC2F9|nr:hypothetical protein [Actinoplanes rectilineatus]